MDPTDQFTPEFKRLKARRPLPNLDSVIDLQNFDHESNNVSDSSTKYEGVIKQNIKTTNVKSVLGLKPCTKWNVFNFEKYPGFMVVQNPFLDGYQRYWVSRCLQDFPSDRENINNLSNLGDNDSFGLWRNFVKVKRESLDKDEPLRKLRWTTLGYHHNWNTKEYSEDRKATLPTDLACLMKYFAHCLEFSPYNPEAAVVNYYHFDSTLNGHVDISELDHTAPLFSISFGQTAVFMLGGPTKETKPMSVFLRSGDICIMYGPGRLAYHAVPKILSFDLGYTDLSVFDVKDPASNGDSDVHETSSNVKELHPSDPLKDSSSQQMDVLSTSIDIINSNIADTLQRMDWSPFNIYLQHSRINLNARQVFPPGNKSLQYHHEENSENCRKNE